MARRLVPFTERQVNASRDIPTLTPATANVRFTADIPAQRVPDPPRAGDFNTRPSRQRFYHGGNSLSLFIMREGFERSTVRAGFPRHVRLGLAHGQMLPVRQPAGNSPPYQNSSWGTILDTALNRAAG